MAQTNLIINMLKKSLKAHDKTYVDVAKVLDLTEASVKRLFSEKSFSLQRLDQVCQMIGMEIADLVQMINEERRQLKHLSVEQEQQIVSDLNLLLVTICVLNRWKFNDIIYHYRLSDTECIRYLAQLDRLKIIELLPGNKIKLLVTSNFNWRKNGPIEIFFHEKIVEDFLKSRFNKDHEKLIVINGMLSKSSSGVFQRKMERLAKDFDELNNDDAGLPISERHGQTAVIAMRGWQYGLFDHLRNKP